ncbi:MAG: phage terminase large subunit [Oscillospiraceae bacterium]
MEKKINKATHFINPPNDKQRLFLTANTRYVAYGGARGGGKSWAVRQKAMLLAAEYAGIRMLLLRRTFPELRENHILPLQRSLMGLAVYKDSEKAFTFVNGSRLKFGYCDGEDDVLQYQGQEYDIIFLDEATQFSEFQFEVLTAALRGANTFPKRFYLTCNPGGVGHAWVKRLFIDKRYRKSENADDYTFIAATVYDNKALTDSDIGYVKMLENLPEDLRRAWLLGDWDVFEGQYFTEFRRETHVCEPFSIPKEWRKYLTMDYGLDMLAALWIAVDNDGKAWVYRELYKTNLIISEAAREVKACMENEEIYLALAPPDLFNRRQETGRSVADIFAENGLTLNKTGNDRVPGWLSVKEWLHPIIDLESGEMAARMQIFTQCVNLIRTLPALRCDEHIAGDVANAPHELTHAPDALRGFCTYWTQKADMPILMHKNWSSDMQEDYENASAEEKEYLEKKWAIKY